MTVEFKVIQMMQWLIMALLLGATGAVFASTIFSPASGVVCDKKSNYCVDEQGISMGLTKHYLGQKAQDALMNVIGDGVGVSLTEYTLSNGVYCDSNKKQCYVDRYYPQTKEKFERKLTMEIFVPMTTKENQVPQCQADQIKARFDSKKGAFDGMSQQGFLLILRNHSKKSCTLEALPTLAFKDANNTLLNVKRNTPKDLSSEPALLPVIVQPDKEVSMRLHWVSSNVFDDAHCVTPNKTVLTLQGGTVSLPFNRQICSPKGNIAFFDQTQLEPMIQDKY